MSIISLIQGLGHTLIGYLVPFLFVLTIVVFFHELGHFLVARWCGVAIKAFSIGFGPELIGFNDRKGTRWKLSAIPLGGYVKFLGDENEASAPDTSLLEKMTADERAGAFAAKSVAQRAAIVAAGPIANFILAVVIFATIFTIFGRQITTPRVDQVVAGGVAEAAGIMAGDVITAIDGSPIESFSDLQRIVTISAGTTLHLTINRDGQTIGIDATPRRENVSDQFGGSQNVGVLGISRSTTGADVITQRFSPPQAVWLGAKEVWFVIDRTFSYLGGVVTGRESPDQLGGPIRVAQVSGQVASIGFVALINLAALLSVSIGLINLFPVPMLDGGHLLFYALEALRGRPLSDRAQDIGFRIGLALVILLMVFATGNDLGQLGVFRFLRL